MSGPRRLEACLPKAPQELQIAVPEAVSAGVWANFATVSHSPYEFTIDFVRLDFAHTTGDAARALPSDLEDPGPA